MEVRFSRDGRTDRLSKLERHITCMLRHLLPKAREPSRCLSQQMVLVGAARLALLFCLLAQAELGMLPASTLLLLLYCSPVPGTCSMWDRLREPMAYSRQV